MLPINVVGRRRIDAGSILPQEALYRLRKARGWLQRLKGCSSRWSRRIVQDDHEHHLRAATAMSKVTEGLSVPRDRSYYINPSI